MSEWLRRLKRLFGRKPRGLDYGLDWCDRGAQMAADYQHRRWDCSDILLGVVLEQDEPGALRHSDVKPFVFWKVRLDRSGKAPVRSKPRNQGPS